ncbi:MAG: SRPBCC domain-containing protein [Flavobacteriaceae bacterium]|nr:SRPBCC domain-containing protein [Flavobacteriaceae bacterium]
MKTELSFDRFVKKIYLKAPLERIYHLWATEQGITSWFLRSAVYTDSAGRKREPDDQLKAGDTYRWQWHNWEGEEKGGILSANGRDQLELSFADSKVSLRLEEKEDAVLLTLEQYEIPTDEESKMNIYNGCSNGWTFWLANLKAFVEHGILLNETSFDLTKEPMAGHIFVNM